MLPYKKVKDKSENSILKSKQDNPSGIYIQNCTENFSFQLFKTEMKNSEIEISKFIYKNNKNLIFYFSFLNILLIFILYFINLLYFYTNFLFIFLNFLAHLKYIIGHYFCYHGMKGES